MNDISDIGKISRQLVSRGQNINGCFVAPTYKNSLLINEDTDMSHENSIITKKYVDNRFNSICSNLLGEHVSNDLERKYTKLDCHLNLNNNSLTDTSDSSLTGKALDQLVVNTSNKCGELLIIITNAKDEAHNGLWVLNTFMGPKKNVNDLPNGCCYMMNDSIVSKESDLNANCECNSLDHSVKRLNRSIEKITVPLSIKIEDEIVINNLTSYFNVSEDNTIEQFHSISDRIFNIVSSRIVMTNQLEVDSIKANSADISNIKAKELIVNGVNILEKIEELENKSKKRK